MAAIIFYFAYSIIWLVALLPMPVLYLISDLIYLLIYYLVGYRKKVVLENLKRSFPSKPDNELKQIRKKFYRHFADIIVEIAAQLHFSEEEIIKRCTLKNPEVLDRLYESNKSVTAVFGHYGNWEWTSGLALQTSYNCLAIYKPLSNKSFDNFMVKTRQQFGVKVVPMGKIYRTLSEAKNANRQTLTYFIADQSPMKRDIKLWIDFLNQKTGVFLGADKISKKLNNAIVYFKTNKLKRGYYEIEVILLYEDLTQVAENELILRHMNLLEQMIVEKPENWLWTHRRWKHQPSS